MLVSARIRLATIDDARSIAELHIRSWQWAYKGLIPDSYLESLPTTLEQRVERNQTRLASRGRDERMWVAEEQGRVVGYVDTGPSRDADAASDTAEVYAIYLEPEASGKGIGRALLAHAVQDLRQRGYRQATLWVLESNARARRFYEAAGWLPDGAAKTEEMPGALLHEVRCRVVFNPQW